MFFTLEDERARIKGSRDPLGVQTLWAGFGRHVVSNLTTVSSSVRGFTVLLLARYYGQRLVEDRKANEEDALSIFLRFEQIGAYARHHAHGVEGDIRGIERVKKNVREARGSVRIDDDSEAAILSDQKTYGLWGLFSVPARLSGLIPPGPVGITPEAREFVEATYVPRLAKAEQRLQSLLRRGGTLALRKNDPVYSAVAAVLRPKYRSAELAFYRDTLRDARRVESEQCPSGRQALIAEQMKGEEVLDSDVDRKAVLALSQAARTAGNGLGERLAVRLQRIADLEAFVAPAEEAFLYLMGCHGQPPAQAAEALKGSWGAPLPYLSPNQWELLEGDANRYAGPELTSVMRGVYEAFLTGDFAAVVQGLLVWNQLVMQHRGGYPWVGLTRGRLDVRYRSDELPDLVSHHPRELWRNSYFLDSLRSVTRQLDGGN